MFVEKIEMFINHKIMNDEIKVEDNRENVKHVDNFMELFFHKVNTNLVNVVVNFEKVVKIEDSRDNFVVNVNKGDKVMEVPKVLVRNIKIVKRVVVNQKNNL